MIKKQYLKIISFSFFIVLMITFFSGCTNDSPDNPSPRTYTDLSSIQIKAPEKAYFDETIEFDVSYDKSEQKITSYWWDFQDGNTVKGKKVKHEYQYNQDYVVEFPVIYTVALFIEYDDNSVVMKNHRIRLYPDELTFYLQKDNLSKRSLSSSDEKISEGGFSFLNQKELSFSLNKPVYLYRCEWYTTLYFEKPLLSNIKEIKIIFYDENDLEIKEKKVDAGLINLGKKKTVVISGDIDHTQSFKSIKLVISVFSLKDDFYILYGGAEPSNICFKFNN